MEAGNSVLVSKHAKKKKKSNGDKAMELINKDLKSKLYELG